MTAQVIAFPKLPDPVDGAWCPVSGCSTPIDYPLILCTDHTAMVPRPILCRIRRAWRAGSVNDWGAACVAAVRAVEDRLDTEALARGEL
jgi:hypothetical protein